MILKRIESFFWHTVEQAGILEYDGEPLWLTCSDRRIAMTDAEQARFLPVRSDTRIASCHRFDLFLVRDDEPQIQDSP